MPEIDETGFPHVSVIGTIVVRNTVGTVEGSSFRPGMLGKSLGMNEHGTLRVQRWDGEVCNYYPKKLSLASPAQIAVWEECYAGN